MDGWTAVTDKLPECAEGDSVEVWLCINDESHGCYHRVLGLYMNRVVLFPHQESNDGFVVAGFYTDTIDLYIPVQDVIYWQYTPTLPTLA